MIEYGKYCHFFVSAPLEFCGGVIHSHNSIPILIKIHELFKTRDPLLALYGEMLKCQYLDRGLCHRCVSLFSLLERLMIPYCEQTSHWCLGDYPNYHQG